MWFAAIGFFALGASHLPRCVAEVGALAMYDSLADPRIIYFVSGGVAVTLLPLVLGLLMVILAGELSHAARLRVMREEMDDGERRTRGEYERIIRRQHLILAVSGPSFPTSSAAGRFLAQLMLIMGAPLMIASLVNISWEKALPAPALAGPSAVVSPNLAWLVFIDESGRVRLNGTIISEPGDRTCLRLRDALHAGASLGAVRVALFVEPGVPTERFIDILNAVESAGATAIIVDETVP